jgi:hypothetical protein
MKRKLFLIVHNIVGKGVVKKKIAVPIWQLRIKNLHYNEYLTKEMQVSCYNKLNRKTKIFQISIPSFSLVVQQLNENVKSK